MPGSHSSNLRESTTWKVFALLLVLAAGLRFVHLDQTFWTDEYRHVIAAQSLLAYGEPNIPEKGLYTKGLPITYLTAWSFRWLGEGELAARLPFLIINLAFLLIFFVTLKRLFHPITALIATGILAVSPDELQWGRECRMYSLFQLTYFSGSVLCFLAFETLGRRRDPESEREGVPAGPTLAPLRRWSCLLLGTALIIFAIKVHTLGVNFPIAVVSYCVAMAAWIAATTSLRSALKTRYGLVLAAVPTVIALVALVDPGFFDMLFRAATEKPSWYAYGNSFYFYHWFFAYSYAPLTLAFLVGAPLLIRDYPKAGLFAVCSFAPLVYMHVAHFTGRYEPRYMAYILPFFLIPAAYAMQRLGQVAVERIRGHWQRGARTLAVTGTFVAVLGSTTFLFPWVLQTPQVVKKNYTTDWKSMADTLSQLSVDAVVMTTWPQVLTYYARSFPDYILWKEGNDFGKLEDKWVQHGRQKIHVRFLSSAAEVEVAVDSAERVYVVADTWAFHNNGFIDQPTREYIVSRFEPVEHGGDERILIYQKRPSVSPTQEHEENTP